MRTVVRTCSIDNDADLPALEKREDKTALCALLPYTMRVVSRSVLVLVHGGAEHGPWVLCGRARRTVSNVLWQATHLKTAEWAVGLAVYTGTGRAATLVVGYLPACG